MSVTIDNAWLNAAKRRDKNHRQQDRLTEFLLNRGVGCKEVSFMGGGKETIRDFLVAIDGHQVMIFAEVSDAEDIKQALRGSKWDEMFDISIKTR